jgi:NTE family protein
MQYVGQEKRAVGQDGRPLIALVMGGGGARAAYQVGVLKAIAKMVPPNTPNPFPILSGTSAGAINAAALAVYARDFQEAVRRLNFIWKNFHVEQVLSADAWGLFKTSMRWFIALALGGLGKHNPQALFDRAPLKRLLETYMPCEDIQASIDAGALRALSVTASGYGSGQSVTFFQGLDTLQAWTRPHRIGSAGTINVDHLMASSAIPFLFSAVKLNREYFGDGSMRQIAPISPALHLGAEKIFAIGVRNPRDTQLDRAESQEYPSLAQIGGHVLNTIFLDALETDLERLQRLNRLARLFQQRYSIEQPEGPRVVDAFYISPSRSIEQIAAKHSQHLPRALRLLLRGVGAKNKHGSNLVSYLLFERPYTRELIALGYADAMTRSDEILRFLEIEAAPPSA